MTEVKGILIQFEKKCIIIETICLIKNQLKVETCSAF